MDIVLLLLFTHVLLFCLIFVLLYLLDDMPTSGLRAGLPFPPDRFSVLSVCYSTAFYAVSRKCLALGILAVVNEKWQFWSYTLEQFCNRMFNLCSKTLGFVLAASFPSFSSLPIRLRIDVCCLSF